MLRKTLLTLSVSALLGTAVVVPNAALAFGPPPILGDILLAWVVLLLALASVVLLVILEPVVLLVSVAVPVAVFRVTCMASKSAPEPSAPAGLRATATPDAMATAMAGRDMAAGHAMAPMPTAVPLPTAVPMPIAAATTLTATGSKGAFGFVPKTE